MENINVNIDALEEVETPEKVNLQENKTVPNTPEVQVPVETGLVNIGVIKSALFGGFTKILSFLAQGTGSQDIIYIKNGGLKLIKNAGFIHCDLSVMFGDHDIEILDPSKSIKLLNLIKGGDEVVFMRDDANARYLISNIIDGQPNTTITLPQPDRSIATDIDLPDVGEVKFRRDLDVEIVDNIQNASKALESQFLKLEIDNNTNKILSISTSDDIFKQVIDHLTPEEQANADIEIYRVFNPFPISKPDDLYFEISEDNQNNRKWITTVSSTGMVNVNYMEVIEPVGEFDAFSL